MSSFTPITLTELTPASSSSSSSGSTASLSSLPPCLFRRPLPTLPTLTSPVFVHPPWRGSGGIGEDGEGGGEGKGADKEKQMKLLKEVREKESF